MIFLSVLIHKQNLYSKIQLYKLLGNNFRVVTIFTLYLTVSRIAEFEIDRSILTCLQKRKI